MTTEEWLMEKSAPECLIKSIDGSDPFDAIRYVRIIGSMSAEERERYFAETEDFFRAADKAFLEEMNGRHGAESLSSMAEKS